MSAVLEIVATAATARQCTVCRLPTGDANCTHCPLCLQLKTWIQEAHGLDDESRGQTKLPPDALAERENRIRKYQRRAAQLLPLFD